MTFLSLLLVLGVVWTTHWRLRLQRDGWWRALLAEVELHVGRHSSISLIVVVGVPLLILALVLAVLKPVAYGWLLLPVHVLVLLYSLGRHDPRQALAGFRDSWRRGDLEAAALRAEQDLGLQAETPDGLLARVQEQLLWRGHEGFFAVIFWYVVLGPLMALAYRLVALTAAHARSPALRAHAEQLCHAFDWLPARLLTASFALVGDFLCASRATLSEWLNWDIPTPKLLADAGRAAADLPVALDAEAGVHSLDTLWQLLVRAAVLWYVLLALWTVVGR
ncbi:MULTISPECIES: regulatory signaling modulator protein AmpE [unclassified Pseudomonas]|uniref:regulatory signaling modulator protein AmpE n=1 Tax=unclassified Pseudomonas TaxID=196821 RepID=UPI002580A7E3|nr:MULTISPECIES: regulatory signaling modulator protein AmpE [unclassified Pseudomonas]